MLSLRVYAAWTGPLSSGTDISGRVDLHGCAPPLRNHTHMFIMVLLLTSDLKVPKRVELTITVTTTHP
ncbi:hypothetical protein AB205_0065690 [Aquarana catesbeiana]|uniref:Uncharacterized protein n=1 Tax=Aquarana catesbeiana TaxID=8400 RepID=A0A2G9S532_AQUCT|nr:hypothetical protein AB205_0065690 [Aquarana catesbeiana]